MSSIPHTPVSASIPIARGRRVVALTNELKSRRCAGDFSRLPPIVLTNNHPPPNDDDDGLQRIPSTSTALLYDDAVSVYTNSSGTLTTFPIADYVQLPAPSHDVYKQLPLTEAQRIAARYRQRNHSSSDAPQGTAAPEPTIPDVSTNPLKSWHPFPSNTVMRTGLCVDGRAADTAFDTLVFSNKTGSG